MGLVFGIDFSLSTPAVCRLADDGSFANSDIYFLTSRKKDLKHHSNMINCSLHPAWDDDEERYDNISNTLCQFIGTEMDFVGDYSPTIFIEGYALGAKGKVFNLAEATGILKHKLHNMNLNIHSIPPTVVKKYATGRGNAPKEVMFAAWIQEGNSIDSVQWWYNGNKDKIGSPVSDIIDSYYIARCGKFTINT